MKYLDVCAGISASTVAWKPLGWEAAAYSEIEAAPRAVLEHRQDALPVGWNYRYSAWSNTTPLFGDFTQIEAHHVGPIDLLVGGTPCQDFSVAGLRAGLDGDRGNLSLEFLRLADRTRPRWVVWENVPGVLSIDGGRAFGAILGGLGELGYGFAYRVLDAQHFGVPQRRRRVFVVGCLGDWRGAGAVLSERHSMSGHPAPRRSQSQDVAGCLSPGAHPGGFNGQDAYTGHLIAHSLRGEGFDASEDGTGRGTPLIPVCIPIDMRQASRGATMTNNRAEGSSGGAPGTGIGEPGDPAPTVSTSHVSAVAFAIQERAVSENLASGSQGKGYQADTAYTLEARHDVQAVAFDMRGRDGGAQFEGPHDTANIRAASGGSSRSYVAASAVRRLTPRECERLQGFPDDYTLVPHRGKPMADGPRYKALGNSMAVPVMAWIGQRIAMVDALSVRSAAA